MTKEELEKEAWQYADKVCGWDKTQIFDYLVEAYLASAEPREKQIQEKDKKIAELEHQLTHRNCLDCSNHSSKLRMKTLELEKENAELNGKLLEQKQYTEFKCNEAVKKKEIYEREHFLLTEAKELLKRWVDDKVYTVSEQKDLIADTEQFLKE